jgi:large subunit ribosomal protein L23
MTSIYEVLRRPIITEKSSYQNGVLNQVVFEVPGNATKPQIKRAVEAIFEVDVVKINTMVMPAKRTRRLTSRRQSVRRKQYKKAVITLKEGQSVDVFEGVK